MALQLIWKQGITLCGKPRSWPISSAVLLQDTAGKPGLQRPRGPEARPGRPGGPAPPGTGPVEEPGNGMRVLLKDNCAALVGGAARMLLMPGSQGSPFSWVV
jgi:hypothetical protein